MNRAPVRIAHHQLVERAAAALEGLNVLLTPSARWTSAGLDYYPLTKPGERFPINDPSLAPRYAAVVCCVLYVACRLDDLGSGTWRTYEEESAGSEEGELRWRRQRRRRGGSSLDE